MIGRLKICDKKCKLVISSKLFARFSNPCFIVFYHVVSLIILRNVFEKTENFAIFSTWTLSRTAILLAALWKLLSLVNKKFLRKRFILSLKVRKEQATNYRSCDSALSQWWALFRAALSLTQSCLKICLRCIVKIMNNLLYITSYEQHTKN